MIYPIIMCCVRASISVLFCALLMRLKLTREGAEIKGYRITSSVLGGYKLRTLSTDVFK